MSRLFELIRFTGPDAADFLQGQLTQDVRLLAREAALLAAWCNPKGRVISVLRLLETGADLGLVVPSGLAETLVKRFAMYRLRARVEIAVDPGWRIAAIAAEKDRDALERLGLLPAPARLAARRAGELTALALGGPAVEVYGPARAFDGAGLELTRPLHAAEWHRALIVAGIPTITAATTEKYTPHMLNLDGLGAVSFQKGCYTGQEVVARTEHLGRVKRGLARYCLEDGGAAAGDRLVHGNREVGEVVDAAGDCLLAVVPVELHGEPLAVNGHTASPPADPPPGA